MLFDRTPFIYDVAATASVVVADSIRHARSASRRRPVYGFTRRSIGPTFHAAASASALAPRAPADRAGAQPRIRIARLGIGERMNGDDGRQRRVDAPPQPPAKLPDGHAAAFDRHVDGRTHQRIAERRGDAIRQHAGVARASARVPVATRGRSPRRARRAHARRRRRRGRPAPRLPGAEREIFGKRRIRGSPAWITSSSRDAFRELAAGFERAASLRL